MSDYDPKRIEGKWQEYWEREGLHETKDSVRGKKNYLLLTEFPYPSGNLHIGHWYAFALPDIRARYLRMKGWNVLYPVGFDAFGLPAENAAIGRGINPRTWTQDNIAYMSKQLRSMGATFDWSRHVTTIDPDYFRWTQWMFLKMYEKGLAYRAETSVNWCPKDKTVLANEQVVNGSCERCDTPVVQKEIEQWLFKITDYADRLIDDMEGLDWPETTKLAQQNWIGRSEGVTIKFYLASLPGQAAKSLSEKPLSTARHDDSAAPAESVGDVPIGTSSPDSAFSHEPRAFRPDKASRIGSKKHFVEVFTTRPDTLFGVTAVVISPELAAKWLSVGWQASEDVKKYIETAITKRELDRLEQAAEKTGLPVGIQAINPANNEAVPVWVADYVLGHYGTGAVMMVPAHDERDFAFAKKFQLPIQQVITTPENGESTAAWTGEGVLMNSGEYSSLPSDEARQKITSDLQQQELAEPQKTYRLHDWVLSRQRYWGVPIPVIHCETCGYQPVPEKELPVELPELQDFLPTEDGMSPLAKATNWVEAGCPNCGGAARRETDTMDTFVDSSWYFMRYTDPHNRKKFADAKKMKQWLPVPMYVGGAEHNTMHLLYSRFFTKVLFDLGYVHFSEPFTIRINRGIILGPDGQKMSKSRGNVVDPDAEVGRWGADAVRLYLAFMGPYEQGGPWNADGIAAIARFLRRVWRLVSSSQDAAEHVSLTASAERALHYAIKKVGHDIDELQLNTAVSELMKLLNALEDAATTAGAITSEDCGTYLKLLAPLAPHIAEELWQEVLGQRGSIHQEAWPTFDEAKLAAATITLPVQVNGKVRASLEIESDAAHADIEQAARELPNIAKYLTGATVQRVVYIEKRLINFVIE